MRISQGGRAMAETHCESMSCGGCCVVRLWEWRRRKSMDITRRISEMMISDID